MIHKQHPGTIRVLCFDLWTHHVLADSTAGLSLLIYSGAGLCLRAVSSVKRAWIDIEFAVYLPKVVCSSLHDNKFD